MSVPIVVIGGGGHARVVLDALRLRGAKIIGVCDPALPIGLNGPFGVEVLGDDGALVKFPTETIGLVNGVGSVQSTSVRRQVFEALTRRGYKFVTVVHPSAIVASDVLLGEGVQVMAGAVIQTGTTIGSNTIINTGARIDHDCRIGAHVHLAPSATLSGNVVVGECTHLGVASTVIQQVSIGRNCLVGAGTVVLRDLADNARLISPPSRTLPEVAS